MTERGAAHLARTQTSLALGRSALQWTGDRLVIDIDEVSVPLLQRVRGRVTLTPQALTETPFPLDDGGRHAWWPLAPRADVAVALDTPGWHWSGEGYLDRNWGMEPLEAAFDDWTWSRTSFGTEMLLLYDAALRNGAQRALALCVDRRGDVRPVASPRSTLLPRTAWRLPRATRSDGPAMLIRSLEDAPFYARASIATQWQGLRGIGMHEALSLRRFRSRVVQAMLPFRMPRRPRVLG